MYGRIGTMTGIPTTTNPVFADFSACCDPITGGVLDTAAAERLAAVLKALAEPTRLRLVSLIAAHDRAEACVCDLTDPVGLSQPTVSHHLRILADAGLIERDQRGKWAYYRLIPGVLDALAGVLATADRRRRAADSAQQVRVERLAPGRRRS
ncbi:ArsR family transcriptional regulator [Mycobacterium xenopi]|uniref:HTH arsR-type domain-containing protein n=2 Tax=Mycobacterium xenopi TaxID=1789 RepID=A0AAD1GWL6_MYCXE|nr:hypothetical protein MYXE_04570 [Mycobacterium xenopi]SPX79427.1 ArsR family transcriptional regulator [Mycobacterium xenopi]